MLLVCLVPLCKLEKGATLVRWRRYAAGEQKDRVQLETSTPPCSPLQQCLCRRRIARPSWVLVAHTIVLVTCEAEIGTAAVPGQLWQNKFARPHLNGGKNRAWWCIESLK
jgi:hypothetical protein